MFEKHQNIEYNEWIKLMNIKYKSKVDKYISKQLYRVSDFELSKFS